MQYRKITAKEFTEQFHVKPFKGQFDCYGTWNGLDMYELSNTPENARIAMWQALMASGWAYTHREEVLMKLASTCFWAKNDTEIQRVALLNS
jgi:hypothetical protein